MIMTGYPLATPAETRNQRRQVHRILSQWHMRFGTPSSQSMRRWGYGAFVLICLLYASFYPIAKPALDRIDTTIFVAAQMLWLVPPALVLLLWSRWRVNGQMLLQSVALGTCMSAALFCLTWAIAYTSITETAMFSCLNGVIVVLLSWLLRRHHLPLLTWLACLCSIGAVVVLLSVSRVHWQGDLLAFVGGLLLTGYTFLIERWYFCAQPQHAPKRSLRAACGIEWLTMAGETLLVALLFGDWHSVHLFVPSDLLIVSYVSMATTLLPMVLMIALRRYVDGVTITFIAILEPIADACFAGFFAHEHFLPQIYLGGVLAIGSVVLQACASRSRAHSSAAQDTVKQIARQADPVQDRLGMMPDLPVGRRARALLTQLWERSDGMDLFTLQRLTGIPCGSAHRILLLLQKQGYVVSSQKTHEMPRYRLSLAWDR